MLKINKRTKTKSQRKPTLNFKNYSHTVCVYHYVQQLYTTQHRTVLIIFLLILQTIITAMQLMSTGGQGVDECGEVRRSIYAVSQKGVALHSCQ